MIYKNAYFNYLVLTGIAKRASLLFDDVSVALKNKGFVPEDKSKPTYSGKITIPGAKPGVYVQVPDNPIINGKYNVFFQIRGGKNPTQSGINTIIVTAEAGGMASGENTAAFGNSAWVKAQLNTIQNTLSKRFGNVSLGKLGFGSFSGGYAAVAGILSDKEIQNRTDSVIVLDGIHHGKRGQPNPVGMKTWLDYAEKAKNDPSKKFVFVYTAVDPTHYASTSDSANYLNSNLGAEVKPFDEDKTYYGIKPAGIANSGGYTAIQLFDRKNDESGYGYTEKEQRKQHVAAAKALPDVWNQYLEDWNTE